MLTADRIKYLNRLCLCAILAYTVWYTVGFQLRHHSLAPQYLLDYAQNYERSRLVAEQLIYPPWSSGFLYPPPNVVLRLELGRVGLAASGVIWMTALIAATLLCLRLSLSLMNLTEHPARYIIALLALSSVTYFFEWDLKYLNGNVLYLSALLAALVWHRRQRPVQAGFWLALSMVLKVYSVVFLPYFLLKRDYRLCRATIGWLAVLFIGLPVVYFGPAPATALIMNWIEMVLHSGNSPNLPFELAAYVLSLHKTLLTLLTTTAGKGIFNVLNLGPAEVLTVTRIVQGTWLVLVLLYFWNRLRRSDEHDRDRATFLDAGALTLSVLPLSPALQPHHGVVMLMPAMALIGVAWDAGRSAPLRWSAGVIVLACYVELEFGPALALRGVGMMATIVLFMAGLILITAGDPTASRRACRWPVPFGSRAAPCAALPQEGPISST